VGLPSNPTPQDHLEGTIAQYLWYCLKVDAGESEFIHTVTLPGFHATAPGGDGLVIHWRSSDGFSFRLWELKKCTGRSSVGSTVSKAFSQLESQGAKYLAQYTSVGQESSDTALAELYGNLVEDWLSGTSRAGVGVAVHTSGSKVPKQCFTKFASRFARFRNSEQLRGLVTAVEDFSQFAQSVQVEIWKGL
jgi:hypothetical protein